MAENPGGGAAEVGGVSFRIAVDLGSFERDLARAEEMARSRVAAMQQQFDSLSMGRVQQPLQQQQLHVAPTASQSPQQQQPPVAQQVAQTLQKIERDIETPPPSTESSSESSGTQGGSSKPPSPVDRVRRVHTRDYHTTDRGGGPEPVTPPNPVQQQRDIETRDVRSSIAAQPLPAAQKPSSEQQTRIVGIPGPPPQAASQPQFPLTPVPSASGQNVFVPTRLSGPTQTQRQIPASVSGVPAAQRPLVHLPPPSSPTTPAEPPAQQQA